MISNDRIGRKQRPGRFKNRKTLIAYLLSAILIVLVLIVILKGPVGEVVYRNTIGKMLTSVPDISADSLAIQVGQSFMLDKSLSVDTVSRGDSGFVVRIIQPWPSHLPTLIYAERLENRSRNSGFLCDCVRFGEDDSLLCELGDGGSTSAEVLIRPERKTRLENRSAGIILKDLYKLDNSEIVDIVEIKIPIGYLADIDVFPAGEIKQRLRSRWVTSLLSIPTDREVLARLIPSGNRKGKKGRGSPDQSAYRDFASDLLSRYPNLSLIEFEKSDDPDYHFVEAVVDQANLKEIDYIYRNTDPDQVDSLAYGSGMTFIDGNSVTDCTDLGLPEIQKLILTDMVNSTDPIEKIVEIDISKIKSKDLIRLLERMRRIGIDILRIDKLGEQEQFTVTDL